MCGADLFSVLLRFFHEIVMVCVADVCIAFDSMMAHGFVDLVARAVQVCCEDGNTSAFG